MCSEVWCSLKAYEAIKGRSLDTEKLGRIKHRGEPNRRKVFLLERASLQLLWIRAEVAWATGWLQNSTLGSISETTTPSPFKPADCLSPCRREDVRCVAPNVFKWGGWQVSAETVDEACEKIQERWAEHQSAHNKAQQLRKKRRLEQLHAVQRDVLTRRGPVEELTHSRYTVVFKGTFFYTGDVANFEEEHTGFVATCAAVDKRRRNAVGEERCKLYLTLRAEHAQRRKLTARASAAAAGAVQMPSCPGDLTVRGKTPLGSLAYTWQAVDNHGLPTGPLLEVTATPRALRPALADGESESAWKQTTVMESTPDRALRKMRKKIQYHVRKSRRGEAQRIVAVASTGLQPHLSVTSNLGHETKLASPALANIDDPNVLGHLRASFEFLMTCDLQYCENCDEEWPVFDHSVWPQGGVTFAGPRAGKCETIAKAGWVATRGGVARCTRCANPNSAYAKMYSKSNGQHLGQRWPGLSELTWYESLLIARVHAVISVVTLTATGLLCYAGHVCNYYVKVMEWFRELPALLRDRKWFLVKRRKTIHGCGSGVVVQKKPTTANRVRLENAIREAKVHMPNVYADSVDCPDTLSKFPVVGEQEFVTCRRGSLSPLSESFGCAGNQCGRNREELTSAFLSRPRRALARGGEELQRDRIHGVMSRRRCWSRSTLWI